MTEDTEAEAVVVVALAMIFRKVNATGGIAVDTVMMKVLAVVVAAVAVSEEVVMVVEVVDGVHALTTKKEDVTEEIVAVFHMMDPKAAVVGVVVAAVATGTQGTPEMMQSGIMEATKAEEEVAMLVAGELTKAEIPTTGTTREVVGAVVVVAVHGKVFLSIISGNSSLP